jgi:hypothetical protein
LRGGAVRLRFVFGFGLVVVFMGAAVVACAGWTLAAAGFAGAAAGGVFESSTVGLGEAMTCCCFMSFGATSTGSISPPEATQAA